MNYANNWVDVDTLPFATVTITVAGKATFQHQADQYGNLNGWELRGFWTPSQPDIEPGDIVTATALGLTAAVAPVATIQGEVDATTDTVSGTIQAPWFAPQSVKVACEIWENNGPNPIEVQGVNPDGGSYLCDFSGSWDIQGGHTVAVRLYEPDDDEVINVFETPYARVNQQWDEVDGRFGLDVTVQYTVTDQMGVFKASKVGKTRPDGWLNGVDCPCNIQPTDIVHVTSDQGFSATLEVITITGQIDVDTDTVTGRMDGGIFPAKGGIWVWSEKRGTGYWTDVAITAAGLYTASLSGQFDILNGDNAQVWYFDSANNQVGTTIFTPFLQIEVNYAHDWVYARTMPYATVAITVEGKATFQHQADQNGNLNGADFGSFWTPTRPDIAPGDIVTATALGLTAAVAPVATIQGEVDAETDMISGTIHAPWFAPQTVKVACDIWEDNGPDRIEILGVNPDGGSYLCDFSGVWDVQAGHTVAVRLYEPDGDQVINVFSVPWMRVNVDHDWVGGDFPVNHTMWLTVSNDSGAIKATAVLSTTTNGGWGGEGFTTQDHDWSPARPDIETGDTVMFQADNGYTNTMQLGLITGTVDIASDSVSGYIHVDWFTGPLNIECHTWGAPAGTPNKQSQATADGVSPFLCQWDSTSEWDVQAEQDIAVMYVEPDRDRVIYVFRGEKLVSYNLWLPTIQSH